MFLITGTQWSVRCKQAGLSVLHEGNIVADGDWLLGLLQDEGIDTSLVGRLEEPTGQAVVEIDGKGENRILIVHGANHCLNTPQIETALQGDPDIVLVQNEVNLVSTILEKAKKAGHRTALNAVPCDTRLSRVALASVDFLIVNQSELAGLSDEKNQERVIERLREHNPAMELVVTLGAQGALAIAPEERWYQQATAVDVVDTTAAGDTFVGFYLSERCRGRPIPECLKMASQAYALAIQKIGAAPSILTKGISTRSG